MAFKSSFTAACVGSGPTSGIATGPRAEAVPRPGVGSRTLWRMTNRRVRSQALQQQPSAK